MQSKQIWQQGHCKGGLSMKNKLREILEWIIEVDDKGRNKVNYDIGKTIDNALKKIKNLKLKEVNNAK